MNKILWLLLGLLAATCAGFIVFHKADLLVETLLTAFFVPANPAHLASDPLLRVAVTAAAAAIAFTVFSGLLPAIGASIASGRVLSRIDSAPQASVTADQFHGFFKDTPLFAGFVEKFSRSLILPAPGDPDGALFAPLSARAVLDPRRESETQLSGWLMQLVPAALFGGGAVLLLLALAAGGNMAEMRPGFPAAALLTSAALICHIFYRAAQRFLEDRYDSLTRAIDALLPHKAELSGLEKLTAASEAAAAALHADIQAFLQGEEERQETLVSAVRIALERPMAELSSEQGTRVHQIAEAVIKAVGRDHERSLAIDVRSMSRAIKSLATMADKTEKQLATSVESLTSQIGQYQGQIASQFESAIARLQDTAQATRTETESQLQQLVTAFELAVQTQNSNFSALVGNVAAALGQVVRENLDNTSNDLLRAAQISREAAERLNGVADQLPEIELRLVSSAGAEALRPLKNPRLTAALRELRDETTSNLPPLE